MSAGKHTPGPWIAKPMCGVSGWVDIVSKEGWHESLPFAACKHFDQEANARLIAEAPALAFDLLAACCYIDALGGDSTKYRQTLAKATGEQP